MILFNYLVLIFLATLFLILIKKLIKKSLLHKYKIHYGKVKEVKSRRLEKVVFFYLINVIDKNGRQINYNSQYFDHPYSFQLNQEVKGFLNEAGSIKLVTIETWLKVLGWLGAAIASGYSIILVYLNVQEIKLENVTYLKESISLFIFLAGLAFLIKGVHEYKVIKLLHKNGNLVKGVITSFKVDKDSENVKIYSPVVKIEDGYGTRHEVALESCYYEIPKIGNELDVLYDKNYPLFAAENIKITIYIKAIFYLIFGVGAIVGSIGLFISSS